MMDSQYEQIQHQLSEKKHLYGKNVHILSEPFLHSQLAKLCSIETEQPLINELVNSIYTSMIQTVINHEFPQKKILTTSRMSTAHPEGKFESPVIDPETQVVTVNLARAGTYPSHLCYQVLNYLMNPKKIRQDHVGIARGEGISGHKIGGKIDDAILLIPDPMGATGGTIVEIMDLYRSYGVAKKIISIHCIVTPEYLKKVTEANPQITVYAARLDRGLSNDKVLQSVPGTYWSEERGLNEQNYIVPGGGGFGEIMNNAYV
jgi:uracil phosphoribosyltransferase